MRFANVTGVLLQFELAGVEYTCEPGQVVDIPDRVAFAVATRGIQLVPASEVEPTTVMVPRAAPAAEPTKAAAETSKHDATPKAPQTPKRR
jgi:hypothetical protein